MIKQPLLRIFLLLALLILGSQTQAAPPEQYEFLPLNKAIKQAANLDKPIFLYFGRYGCSTCRKMHAEVFSDEQITSLYSQQFVLAYVDTESGKRIRLPNGERTTEMQYASRNRILGTPTFFYLDSEFKPLLKREGFQTIEQMAQYAHFVADGHYQQQSLKDYLKN